MAMACLKMGSWVGRVEVVNSDECWDLLDVDGRPTGRTAQRVTDGGDPSGGLGPGDWHRVVAICVFNSQGQLLIQQRAADKVGWPNAWDLSAGGSVLAGETSQEGAARELCEEIGITHDFTGQRPVLTLTGNRGFFDIYLVDADPDLASLELQAEEVQAVQWASLPQVLALIKQGHFWDFSISLIELIFGLHENGIGDLI